MMCTCVEFQQTETPDGQSTMLIARSRPSYSRRGGLGGGKGKKLNYQHSVTRLHNERFVRTCVDLKKPKTTVCQSTKLVGTVLYSMRAVFLTFTSDTERKCALERFNPRRAGLAFLPQNPCVPRSRRRSGGL